VPEIRPFRAFHYHPGLKRASARLVCPPYDVISPRERGRLERSHPDNFVRVELPDGTVAARYARAARQWRRWVGRGTLVRDFAPALYLYEAVFRSQVTGRRLSRLGFFTALRVRPWGRGVFPHEKTLPTPKADRLRLFKALRVQTSPIQLLFDDRSGRAARLLRSAARRAPWLSFRGKDGVLHRLWRWDDPSALKQMGKILARSPGVIADGHHRYETSRAYGAWARARRLAGPAHRYVMAFFSPAADPALEVLPTHRAVGWEKRRFVRLEEWGRLRPLTGAAAVSRLVRGEGPRGWVGVYREGRWYRYDFTALPRALRGTPHAGLAVARLHAGPLDGLGKEDFFFTRRPEEAAAWARKNRGWAFFLAPNTVREVVRVSTSGRVMPPKSTYFYPKIPSGLVSHALEGAL
jgi:uncharacterized protein (DUF1015 family)